MLLAQINFQNIIDADGLGIAFTGMLIVICVLALVCLFISALPWVFRLLAGVLPPEKEIVGPSRSHSGDDEELAVAVGFALHRKTAS